jgi:hypothetical protein
MSRHKTILLATNPLGAPINVKEPTGANFNLSDTYGNDRSDRILGSLGVRKWWGEQHDCIQPFHTSKRIRRLGF